MDERVKGFLVWCSEDGLSCAQAVPNLVRQLSVAGSSGDMTASHRFSLSHDQGGCENFLVQDYVLWPITRALLEWLTQT